MAAPAAAPITPRTVGRAARERARRIRAGHVAERLRAGVPPHVLADELGVSRQRVHQVAAEATGAPVSALVLAARPHAAVAARFSRALRAFLALEQRTLADALGWPPSRVARLEQGHHRPRAAAIVELLAYAHAHAPELAAGFADALRDAGPDPRLALPPAP